jgi:hypothetical protein
MTTKSQDALARIQQNCERLAAAGASLRATMERWQPSRENPIRAGLGSEHYMLKKWVKMRLFDSSGREGAEGFLLKPFSETTRHGLASESSFSKV